MNVLVVASHPDDEILGAGATLAGHASRGDAVHAVVLAEGASSRYSETMVQALQKAGLRAAEEIGFASIRFEGLPDQRLDTIPLIEITQGLEAILEEFDPEVVYTHFPGDVNVDHGVVARAVWTACRPYRFPRIRRLAAFETPSSTEWAWPLPDGVFSPTLFVDVSATIDAKLAAMECYSAELRDYPHPRSTRALRQRAEFWGSMVDRSAVEPFVILREIAP
jgi:LmbE family N-acetylglucosaminyl deacetylase